jgi:hypothetical protein
MKKYVILCLFSTYVLGNAFFPNLIFASEDSCSKQGTQLVMKFTEAKKIALKSDCLKVGKLKDAHWCNDITGTWWINIKSTLKGCYPACVINIADKKASVNYMCTGLLTQKTINK